MTPRYGTFTPISYTNPVNTLRYGGDVTNINTLGNLDSSGRINKRASNIFEADEAKRKASVMSFGEGQKQLGGIKDAYRSIFGSDPMEQFMQGEPRTPTVGKGNYADWAPQTSVTDRFAAFKQNNPYASLNTWANAANARNNFYRWAGAQMGGFRGLERAGNA